MVTELKTDRPCTRHPSATHQASRCNGRLAPFLEAQTRKRMEVPSVML
jgi:hypothetical protein